VDSLAAGTSGQHKLVVTRLRAMRGKKYVIGFVFLAVLAVLAFSVLSNWQTSRKLLQVCEALFRATNLTAMQNDPTNESLINTWKKDCSE
jgi:hypothetical protein